MSVPTAKELLDEIQDYHADENAEILASRVEKVLAYIEEDRSPSVERQSLCRAVRRMLDGEEL